MGYKDEECKECRAHNMYNCSINPNCNSLECPCLTCLIKGMCQEDCKKIEIYVKEVIKHDCTYDNCHSQFYQRREGVQK